MESVPEAVEPSRFRWKIGAALLVIGAILELLVWNLAANDRTHQVIYSLMIVPSTVFLLLLWWLFVSGVSWRARLIGLGALGVAAGLFFTCFRIDGYWGDMLPRLALRWSPTAEERAEAFWKAQEQWKSPAVDSAAASEGQEPELDALSNLGLKINLEITDRDWPHFRGPQRDGVVRGMTVRRDWDERPPQLLWKHPVGLGWSSFAVLGPRIFTQEQRGAEEAVVCYELETGREIWVHTDTARFSEVLGGDGPRATPTLHDGRVYTLGATGILNCLDLLTGKRIWSVNILGDDNEEKNLTWGMAGSPLVYDDVVVVNPGLGEGNSVVAYDRLTGDKVWSAGDDPAAYVSPCLATLGGKRQILIFDGIGLKGHDAETGEELWGVPWANGSNDPMINAAQPLVLDDQTVLIGSGYGQGSTPVDVVREETGWSAQVRWAERRLATNLKLKFNGPVVKDGFLYGLDERILACVDLSTGQRQWKGGRYGYGQLLLIGDVLLVLSESGAVALVEATPERFREITRFQAIEGKTWNHPVIVRNRLLVRNAQEAACYALDGLGENHQNDE